MCVTFKLCAKNVLFDILMTSTTLVRLTFVKWFVNRLRLPCVLQPAPVLVLAFAFRRRKLVHLLKETFSWKVSGSYTMNRCVSKQPTSVCLAHSLTWRQEMPELNCLLSRKWVSTSVKLVASCRRSETPLIESNCLAFSGILQSEFDGVKFDVMRTRETWTANWDDCRPVKLVNLIPLYLLNVTREYATIVVFCCSNLEWKGVVVLVASPLKWFHPLHCSHGNANANVNVDDWVRGSDYCQEVSRAVLPCIEIRWIYRRNMGMGVL